MIKCGEAFDDDSRGTPVAHPGSTTGVAPGPELQSHSVPEVVRRLGYVQIDTIAVIERAHHHVLWTRLPTYEVSQLDRAQGEERQILEYWSHAAAYLPMEDYRFCLPHGSLPPPPYRLVPLP